MEFRTRSQRKRFAQYVLGVTNLPFCQHKHETVNFVAPKKIAQVPTVTIKRGCVISITGEVRIIDLDLNPS